MSKLRGITVGAVVGGLVVGFLLFTGCSFLAARPSGAASRRVFPMNQYDRQKCNDYYNAFNYIPDGHDVTWIGDSYSTASEEPIRETMPDIMLELGDLRLIKSGKMIYNPKAKDNPDGFTLLKQVIDVGELRKYLVFMLGTNDYVSEEKYISYIDQIETMLPDGTVLLLMRPYWENHPYTGSNAALDKLQTMYSNIIIVDWRGMIQSTGDNWEYYLKADHWHPNLRGGKEWAIMVQSLVYEHEYAEIYNQYISGITAPNDLSLMSDEHSIDSRQGYLYCRTWW